jgi:hypothetical protein
MAFEEEAIEYFMSRALAKYRKGKKEHGRGLDEVPLEAVVDELEGEIIDLIFYYYRLKQAIKR